MGRQKLESRASAEIGNDSPYLNTKKHTHTQLLRFENKIKKEKKNQSLFVTDKSSFSRKTTGSGSLIAAFRSPRASSEE